MSHVLSVVIPVYNTGNCLRKCLDSVIRQTYKDIEIIIINDGSTDNSNEIILEFQKKDPRIKVVNQENQGVSKARNLGIDISVGDLIAFVDSDDCLDYCMYEVLINNLDKTKADVSACTLMYEYKYGTILLQEKLNDPYKIQVFYDKEILESATRKKDSIAGLTPNKVYKKSAIGKHRFDEKIRMCEDSLFAWEVFKDCHIACFCDIPMYHYYIRQNSSTRVADINILLEAMEAYKKILINENEIPRNALINLKMQYLGLNITAFHSISSNNDKKYYEKIVENINNNFNYSANMRFIDRFELNFIRKNYFLGCVAVWVRKILVKMKGFVSK